MRYLTAIQNKYQLLGGGTSRLGAPVAGAEEHWLPDDVGRLAQYAGGIIIWSPTTFASALYGVLAEHVRLLAESGQLSGLGYVVADQTVATDDPTVQMSVHETG